MAIDLVIVRRPEICRTFVDLYFNIDGSFFPCEGWGDHRSAPAAWRAELRENPAECRLLFLDGPYEVGLLRRGDAATFSFRTNETFEQPVETLRYVADDGEFQRFVAVLEAFGETSRH